MINFSSPPKVYSLWDTTKAIYLLVKITGYISFSISGKIENGKIKTTILDFVFLASFCSFYSSIIYINFVNDLSLVSTKSLLIDKGSHFVTLFMISNVLLSAITNNNKRHKIWGLFIKMDEFDKGVSN